MIFILSSHTALQPITLFNPNKINSPQSITMKSQETANRTFHHTCNRSTAKYQYSFGREQRFNRRANSANTLDKFYEVPSQILKRGAVFSRAKRDLQKE
jgi:hypothetical protein